MLQIDHIYEFLYQEIFSDFELYHLKNGVPIIKEDIGIVDITVFTPGINVANKIFFYDQEPLIKDLTDSYLDVFSFPDGYTFDQLIELNSKNQLPHGIGQAAAGELEFYQQHPELVYKNKTLVVSERSDMLDEYQEQYDLKILYYFFHGFAALDWYRGHYALNYTKQVVRSYKYDFVSYNRIITGDRAYRIYFVSLLKELGLLDHGLVSFNVTDNVFDDWQDEVSNTDSKLSEHAKLHIESNLTDVHKLIVDHAHIKGSASANIPRSIITNNKNNNMLEYDSFWHMVTETVFYYDKLHLTEKIFKPIVSKQPFMLLAAPGNLAYLRSYGFKTFEGIIDESYDLIKDDDLRTEAVVKQLAWYCSLSDGEKISVMRAVEPIVMHNFHHFYGSFSHIITAELLDNIKTLFKQLGYDDSKISYDTLVRTISK